MYTNELGDIPGVSSLTNPILAIANIFQGKPSDFRVWMYFDNHAHYSRQQGDKPNANTVGMANAVIQAWQQYIAQLEASGASYNLPSDFVVNIGQRDPSYLYMPSNPHGDPFHGGGTNAKSALAGPSDPNGVIQGMITFLKQYMTGNPNTAATAGQATTGSVIANQASNVPPSTALTIPGTASPIATSPLISYSPGGSMAEPIVSPGYVPSYMQPASQAGMLAGISPTVLMVGGAALFLIAMMGNQSAPRTKTRTVYRSLRRASKR